MVIFHQFANIALIASTCFVLCAKVPEGQSHLPGFPQAFFGLTPGSVRLEGAFGATRLIYSSIQTVCNLLIRPADV
jgi:hypothetical protein